MKKLLKVTVMLGGLFAASAFAAGSGTPVTDSNAAVALDQIKTQSAETNALLKVLVDKVSGDTKKACYFDGKLYSQGAVVDNGKQFCSEENGDPKIRPLDKK